jgi:peptidoglycan/LPS O-acetylase OafA/YrhL
MSGVTPVDRMRQSDRSSAFRPDIEGLRGIAVLIVVLFHCGIPGFSGGFVGVDVFFVLSGYLITGLLVAEIQKTSRLSLLRFYGRRIRRLLPASALTLVATLLISAFILAPQELTNAGRAARATALYISNIFFAINAADYFAPDVKSNPMLHTWSLAVEEQFYLFWPLLILLGLRRWRSIKALVALLSGLTLVSLGTGIWFTANGGTFAFYELPARAWEFGIGGLAVLLPRGTLKMPFGGWFAFGWLGVLAILGSAYFIPGDANFPGWIALVPVVGTIAALIAGAEHPSHGIGVVLDSAPLQVLGRLSYSWYLWHWPFLVLSAALLPNISIAGKTAAAAVSLAVAGVSYHFVEGPIRFHPSLLKRPAWSLYLAATLTLCSLGAASLAMWFAVQLANEPEMKTITAAAEDIARMPRQQCVSLGQSPEAKTCIFGDASSSTNIVLFGDSHAIQWFNPLQRIAESHGWKLTTIVKSACPAVDIIPPGVSAGAAAACTSWRAEALQRIVALRPSIVFTGNATNHVGDKRNLAIRFSLDELRDGTRRTLEALTARGLRVAVMRDNPYFTYDVPTCLARSVRHSWYPGGSCEADKFTALSAAVFESEKAGARGLPNVHFIDLTDRLCQKDVCSAVQGGAVIYRDNNHLTGNFADRLMPVLEAELLAILNAPR